MKIFKHRYPSTYASVRQARHDAVKFAAACGLTDSETDDIALAVGEACNNAAEHGHVAGGSFTLTCECDERQLVVEVSDEGKGFLLAGKGETMEPESRGARGLGIFLMRALMDEVVFEINDAGTRVRLTMAIGLPRNRWAPAGQTPDFGERFSDRLSGASETVGKALGVHSGDSG